MQFKDRHFIFIFRFGKRADVNHYPDIVDYEAQVK